MATVSVLHPAPLSLGSKCAQSPEMSARLHDAL